MTAWHWTVLKDSLTLAIAATAAFVGLRTYVRNMRTRRAEFLTSLHKNFFVDDTYKATRAILDDESPEGEASREKLVTGQDAAFTDFLNFFELTAYFAVLGAFKQEDVMALLGYYLRVLKRSGPVYRYICDRRNDFEHLQGLLAKLEP